MRAVRSLIWRLGNLLRPSRTEREMSEELTFHIQSRAEDLVRKGLSVERRRPTGAPRVRRDRALQGTVSRHQERPVFENALRDLIYAWRSLRRSPVLVFVATLSLGLGIGVNTTLLASAVSYLRARFPPWSTRLASSLSSPVTATSSPFSTIVTCATARSLRTSSAPECTVLNLRSRDNVERVNGLAVTANFFDGLGVGAGIGRVFTRDEASPERDPRLAVLSYACWQRRFGGGSSRAWADAEPEWAAISRPRRSARSSTGR